jgi:hypothetical protein
MISVISPAAFFWRASFTLLATAPSHARSLEVSKELSPRSTKGRPVALQSPISVMFCISLSDAGKGQERCHIDGFA